MVIIHLPSTMDTSCLKEMLKKNRFEIPGALWYSDACAIGSAIKMDASVTAAGGSGSGSGLQAEGLYHYKMGVSQSRSLFSGVTWGPI